MSGYAALHISGFVSWCAHSLENTLAFSTALRIVTLTRWLRPPRVCRCFKDVDNRHARRRLNPVANVAASLEPVISILALYSLTFKDYVALGAHM